MCRNRTVLTQRRSDSDTPLSVAGNDEVKAYLRSIAAPDNRFRSMWQSPVLADDADAVASAASPATLAP
jgi:hypothetical protein